MSFKVIDVDISKKLVASACYDNSDSVGLSLHFQQRWNAIFSKLDQYPLRYASTIDSDTRVSCLRRRRLRVYVLVYDD